MDDDNNKNNSKNQIRNTDSFCFNLNFKSVKKVFRVTPPTIEETFSKEKVIQTRSYAIEATVVRIMKHREKL